MPTLTLKGLPDALYERLKLQAAANRRSLNSEVLVCLEQAVAATATDVTGMLARIEHMQQGLIVPVLDDQELRAVKAHGRL